MKKSAERALPKHIFLKEQLYRFIFQQTGLGIVIGDLNGRIETNLTYERMLGYKKKELQGKSFAEITYPDDVKRQSDLMAEALAHKDGTFTIENRYIRKDGRLIWVNYVGSLILGSNNEPIACIATVENITERKRVENALQESEARFVAFMNNSPTIAWMKDEQGRHVYVSKTLENWFDVKAKDWIGKTDFEIWPREIAEMFSQNDKAVLAANKALVVEEYTTNLDGSRCYWLSCKFPFVDSTGKRYIGGIGVDITERKKVEEAFKESEERFRSLVESTTDWIWQVDQNASYTYASPKIKDILGYNPEEVLGKTPFDFMPNDEAQRIGKVFIEIANKKKAFSTLENWNVHKNGTMVLLETSGTPILDEDGVLMGYRGIDRDITERKKAEEALQKSEERFRLVAEVANVMVYETDVITGNVNILRGLKELVGYKPDEVNFTVDWVLNRIHPEDAQKVLVQFKAAIEEGKNYSLEYRFLHKNGTYIIVKDTAKAVRDSSGKTIRFIGGIHDITQRKKDEERIEQYSEHLEKLVDERTKQLMDSERFAAIGKVAGMVGHDIRNPLQAMISDVYLLKSDLTITPESEIKAGIKESLDSIEKNIGYINKIVADLQDYAKKLKPEYSEVNLPDLIISMFETIHIPDTIKLSLDIKALPKLKADLTFIRRALTNLVNNAIQAMPNGGKLEIAGFAKKGKVYLTVSDTGVGIPDEVRAKLFTPMFTTKAKGQGLGLAVVKRLVEAQGGTISFESAIGKGTKFMIELPL